MITLSGIAVMPYNDNAPTLIDIATGLARMPRFAGQTNRDWSVAEHSIVCMHLVDVVVEEQVGVVIEEPADHDKLKMHALLHDAHECVTADIPTTWKSDTIIAAQRRLDKRIYDSLHIKQPTIGEAAVVAAIDRIATIAEAQWMAHPGVVEWFKEDPDERAVAIVSSVANQYVRKFYSTQQIRDEFLGLLDKYTRHD